MTPEILQITLHELRVHQVELEMQNEELRRTQLELDSSRSQYFDLYDLAPVGYCTISEPGVILQANLMASQLLGVARGTLVNRPIHQFIAKDDQDVFYFHCRKLANSGQPQSCELRVNREDRTQVWVRMSSKTDSAANGELLQRVALSDITEIKKAEVSRLESEERYVHVMEATQDGIWDWNIETNHVYYSPQWARLLGFESEDLIPHTDTFYKTVHPDDLSDLEKRRKDHFAGLTAEKHGEVRLRMKSGEYRWFLDRGKIVARDVDGKPTRMVGTITDIEDRKQAEMHRAEAERRLREREGRLRKAQAISKIGNFHWDATTNQVDWSDELFRIYGRTSDTFSPSFAGYIEAIHPDDRGLVMQSLQEAMDSLGDFDHEYRVLRPDGRLIWVHALGNALTSEAGTLSGLEGTCQDISERKKSEEALQWSRSLLQMMSNSSPLGFLVVDNRTDAILYSNARFCEIWGIQHLANRICSGELNNKDITPHCLPVLADIPAFAASCAPLQDESNRITIEDEIAFTENRTVRRFSTQIRDDDDRYYGRFYIFEDITARRQADAERESLQAQLRESQKMEAVGTLAGGIAHDFNNILAVILGNAELAATIGNQNPSLDIFLSEIRKAGIRGRDLVQQILSFSRQRPTELTPISLSAVVQESASLLRATLPARLTLHVDCEVNLPHVLGDATQLEQVILNLVTNSMQAIGNDPGQISIRLDSVVLHSQLTETHPALREMQLKSAGRLQRLSVTDSGPGMSSATVERVFEPFFTTKPVGKGTGLGLSVVHGIVTSHSGKIFVESKEGQGTRFTIYLLPAPAKTFVTLNALTNVNHSPVDPPDSAHSRIFQVLLLDDNEAVLMVARGLLEVRGYRVTSFTNQQEALEAIQSNPFAFDLIITDYNMPGMSGLDLSRAVRTLRPGLPVAVTSGFIDEELRENAAQAGVVELISKPFRSAELFRKIERLLKVSQ